jgi:hypothetical protein
MKKRHSQKSSLTNLFTLTMGFSLLCEGTELVAKSIETLGESFGARSGFLQV